MSNGQFTCLTLFSQIEQSGFAWLTEEHEDEGRKSILPFPFVSFVTFVVNILFSSFNVPLQAGVGDYLENASKNWDEPLMHTNSH